MHGDPRWVRGVDGHLENYLSRHGVPQRHAREYRETAALGEWFFHMRALLLLFFAIGAMSAADPINSKCPVLPDEDVDPAFTVPWNGVTIGLCCAKCVRQFKAEPDKYDARLNLPKTAGDQDSAPAAEAHVEPVPAGPAHEHAHTPSVSAPHLVSWLGRFHPVLVHFPIALAILAAVAEILHRWRPAPSLRSAARVAIIGAAVTALPTILLGWFAALAPHPGMEAVLAWHRWLGTGLGALLIAAAVASEAIHRRPDHWAWRWLAPSLGVLAAILVGIVGHLGGLLVYGLDHYTW